MQACFIGHRTLEITEELSALLKETITRLINCGVTAFLFGSGSDFNDLCLNTVTEIKKEYPLIKRIYVRAEYPYITESYKNHLLESYEETYFSSKLEKAGKASYVERNYDMIDKSDYCVFYFDENYTPIPKRLQKSKLPPKSRKSGTKTAYEYAIKKKKEIINLYR